MSEHAAPARVRQTAAAPQPGSKNEPRLQRKCACGRHSSDGAECGSCAKKRATLQRWSAAAPSPTAMLRAAGVPERAGQAERAGAEEDGTRRGRDFIRVDVREADGRSGAAGLQWVTSALANTVAGNGAPSRFGGSKAGQRRPARLRDTYPAASRAGVADAKSVIHPHRPEAAEEASVDLAAQSPASAVAAAIEAPSSAGTPAAGGEATSGSAAASPSSLASTTASGSAATASAPAAAPAKPAAPAARAAEGAEQRGDAEELGMEEETAAPAPPLRHLIFDEGAEAPRPGQMGRAEFLARLRMEITAAAEEALAGTGRTTEGCPYLGYWFGYYGRRDSRQIERALHRYAPEAAGAQSAADYIAPVVARVRAAVDTWARTGEVTGVPAGLAAEGIRRAQQDAGDAGGGTERVFGAVQLKPREGGGRAAEDPAAIQAELGHGRPLDGGVRTRMEAAFGGGLGPVHLHTGATASRVASGLNARAFTVGRHVAFGAGEYRPGTPAGDALIAHEVAHVVQQRSAASAEAPLEAGTARYDALERDADHAAAGAVASLWGGVKEVARNTGPALRSGLRLQRCATFSEHSSQEYQGFDSSIDPRGLVVPEGESRIVDVRKKEKLTFAIAPAGPATLDDKTPADGITVTGVSHGQTRIEAREGTEVKAQLDVSVKRKVNIATAFHYVHQGRRHTSRSAGDEVGFVRKLNEVWERQANIHFETVKVDSPRIPTAMASRVDTANSQTADMRALLPTGMAGAYNVFLVWEIKDPPNLQVRGTTFGKGGSTVLEDGQFDSDMALAHEAGHHLGLVLSNAQHPTTGIMANLENISPRVYKKDADTVNP